MKIMRITTLFILGVLLALPAWGATKYGDATIEKGKLTVLREGKRLVFSPADRQVSINHLDVIRLGPESSVILQTVEKATITLGSNAVLQVEPWKRREKKGLMRMLFGRFRATVTGLVGAERFNVKTSTATIGVKGTDLTGLQTPNDRTLVWVENSHSQAPVALEGLIGDEKDLEVGFASAVVGTTPAANPVRATPELKEELKNLNAPRPNSFGANSLPPQAGNAGLPTDGGDDGDQGGGDGGGDDGNQGDDAADQAQDQAGTGTEEGFRANIGIGFE